MSNHNQIDTRYTQERELSWLRFNERVLEEAWDERTPLFERLKFAAIFGSNLDEFFMIRVGSIYDMSLVKETSMDSKSGLTPVQQLTSIFKAVPPLYKQRDKLMAQLEQRLRSCNICNLAVDELDNREHKQVDSYFQNYVRPVLSPMLLTPQHPFPHLPSKSLTVALTLKKDGQRSFGIVPVPGALPAFFPLESLGVRYILMEQLISAYAHTLFSGYTIEERCIISVTRNADISPEDDEIDVGEDFRQHMIKVLKKRARLAPVRLEIQGNCSEPLTTYLCNQLQLHKDQVFHSKSPLVMGYVFGLQRKLTPESATALCYPPYQPCWPSILERSTPIIPQIAQRDVLLYYPYHSMEPFLTLLREARRDPDVLSIKITIYRLASKAKIIEYLAAAAENGIDVTVVMELRARFDEQNNIAWAERLEEAGCTVLYGAEGYKLHSKVCLITRKVKGGIGYITQIGTGNYNEKTAGLYTDFCLMTANQSIGADTALFFQNMATSNLQGEYQQLLVSPHSLKPAMISLIDQEIAKADRGQDGYIFVKVNSITDRNLIDKLADASQHGVEVVLNVRGICCLLPQIPQLTENIQVFSVVGRFLEHPRVYIFGKGEKSSIYIGSADFMTRNTERRVEVACPVLDKDIKAQIIHYVTMLCQDNVEARYMGANGLYHTVAAHGEFPLNVHTTMMEEVIADAALGYVPPPLPQTKPSRWTKVVHWLCGH